MRQSYILVMFIGAMLFADSSFAQPFSQDVKTFNRPALNEQQVSMDIAFNGWIYQAFSIDSSFVVVVSKDNGDTWTMIDSVTRPGIQYSVKLVVAGTDTNYLQVCLAINAYNTTTGSTTLAFNYLNGSTGVYTGSAIIDTYIQMTRGFDIVTDYKYPSEFSGPYAVGILYVKGGAYDSLFIAVSIDSGAHFGAKQLVDTSKGYLRKVSLAYGVSGGFSNGRFFMAWEQFNGYTDTVGHVYTTYTPNSISDMPLTKVDIDSIVSLTTYRLCNPKIASSQSLSADNASGNITTVIAVDYIPEGQTNNTILGFSNPQSVGGLIWYSFNLVFTNQNTPQADLTYNPIDTSFMLTYYNQTTGELPYLTNSIDLSTGWVTRLNNYVPDSTNLVAPWPTVRVNPVNNEPAFGWSNAYAGIEQAMFDAVYRSPVPELFSLSPDSVVAGSAAFTLNVTGQYFENSSYIMWNVDSIPATFVSSTQLSVVIPSSAVSTAGTMTVSVVTPDLTGGGGISNNLPFFVVAPLGINSVGNLTALKVYPNPATDQINIAYTLNQPVKLDVALYDLEGRFMKELYNADDAGGSGSINQDVSNLAQGLYQLVINAGDSRTTRKVSIVR